MTLSEAIRQFAAHIRRFADVMVVNIADINAPTPEQLAAHITQVESLCDELDAMAERSPTFAEFTAIRQQLYAINAVAPLGHLGDVQDAFLAAR
jgi:hypothetical protein